MIARLRSYPVMKDSNVKWLDDVPEHWKSSHCVENSDPLTGSKLDPSVAN